MLHEKLTQTGKTVFLLLMNTISTLAYMLTAYSLFLALRHPPLHKENLWLDPLTVISIILIIAVSVIFIQASRKFNGEDE